MVHKKISRTKSCPPPYSEIVPTPLDRALNYYYNHNKYYNFYINNDTNI